MRRKIKENKRKRRYLKRTQEEQKKDAQKERVTSRKVQYKLQGKVLLTPEPGTVNSYCTYIVHIVHIAEQKNGEIYLLYKDIQTENCTSVSKY